MISTKTHVYFVPGLAAGSEIFKNISLSGANYETHIIEWILPQKNESLQTYVQRMCSFVREKNAVLIGVSFGGVVAQEMSKYLQLKKLIIISSVKTKFELPARLKFARKTKVYKILPTSIVGSAKDLTRFAIGPKSKKRLALYNEYLHVKDPIYLDWAIEQMICWDRIEPVPGVIHIHGTKDAVFPIKNIQGSFEIDGGTHVMILTKGSLLTNKIFEIIEN